MNKIVILEDDFAEKSKIEDICSKWPDELEIYPAAEEKRAIRLCREKQIDMLICDLSSGYGPQLDNFSSLTYRFPYIPSLAIIGRDQQLDEEVLKVGASVCLEAPVNSAELRLTTHHLLEESNSGTVRGIPVHSLLQMFESDEKTCTLRVTCKGKVGLIFMENGVVIGAETEELVNEDAMFSIITWEDAVIDIKHYNCQRPTEIQQTLLSIIMEAFRLKDERESLAEKQHSEKKPKLELKHLSTAGNRLTIDVGSKMKMEFDKVETALVSTMVGMIPNQYIIITTPQPQDVVKEALDADDRIVIKYLHMGRLCMFKTKLIEEINSPHNLLFLEYPPIIHFHELRRAKRTNIFVPCTLKHNAGTELNGVLIDLSFMGCLFLAKIRGSMELPNFDINSEIQLCCLLPGVGENQVLQGIVKNFKKSTTELRVGIEFSALDSYLKDAIENYVDSVESVSK